METNNYWLYVFYVLSGNNPKKWLSKNLRNKNMTEEKIKITIFDGLVISYLLLATIPSFQV